MVTGFFFFCNLMNGYKLARKSREKVYPESRQTFQISIFLGQKEKKDSRSLLLKCSYDAGYNSMIRGN